MFLKKYGKDPGQMLGYKLEPTEPRTSVASAGNAFSEPY
jgi:hypothetical protein